MASKKTVTPKRLEVAFTKLEKAFAKLQDEAPRSFKNWKKRDRQTLLKLTMYAASALAIFDGYISDYKSALEDEVTGWPGKAITPYANKKQK